MATNIAEKKAERAVLVEEARNMLDKAENEKRELTTLEDQRFKELMTGIDTIASEVEDDITSALGIREIQNRMNQRSGPSGAAHWGEYTPHSQEEKPVVLRPEHRMVDMVPATKEERELSIGKYVRGIVTGDWKNAAAEQRAMSEGTLSAGGYNVPTYLSANVIDLLRKQARVFQAGAGIVPMASNKLMIAKVTGDPTASWKVENAAGSSSDMVFGAITFQAQTLMALVKVSIELLEDAMGIDAVINNAISQALALELDRVCLYGSGTAPEPRGLKNTSGIQSISMGPNGLAITDYSQFSNAVQKIKEQNGEPNSALMSARTWGVLDRLTDTQGQPKRPPASFDGLTKLTTNQIPTNQVQGTSGAACSEVFVGDWSNLLVGTRTQLQIEISREAGDNTGSAFTNYQVWIRAVLRADVQVARAEQFVDIVGIL